MLESIRKHSKIVMVLLFLLIIPSFVLVGIDSHYFSEKSPVVARVDGDKIRQSDWDRAHRTETDRIRAQSPQIDAQLLDSPQARYASLERLVRERVFAAAAQKMQLLSSDARLARRLQEIPEIAALRRADGTLDAQAYRALVASQGLTPEGFEAGVRRSLSLNQVMGAVTATTPGSQTQARLALDALYQRREVEVARFDAAHFSAQIKPAEAELEAYYQAHPAAFRQAEQASVEYLVLDLDSVRAAIQPSDAELRAHYEESKQRLAGQEERRASHILIEAPKDAPAAEREKAKAHAAELLAQARKNPERFAELARQSSADKGSAAAGGDLDFFSRGAMVKPFEDAAFALAKGQISDLVETEFGYHIIELTDIKTPRQPGFDELRPTLAAELRQQQAQRKFAELAESFGNALYEQADSLQAVAEKFQLKVQTAQALTRKPAPGAQGPLANAKFLQALFAPDSLEHKRNTEAIETGANQLAAGRVSSYSPAQTLPYATVRERVRSLYLAEKSAELARQQGQAQLAAWQAGPDAAKIGAAAKTDAGAAIGLAAAVEISHEQPHKLPRPVIDAALRAPADALPAWVGVDLGAAGYAVVKVNRVLARSEPDAQRSTQERQQYQQWLATAETLAYYEWLQQRFKAQIKTPRPEAPLPTAQEN